MPDRFTKEAFSEHLNTKFRIPVQDAPAVELELIEVVGTISTAHQEEFSIFFRGPQDIFLQQGVYHLEHERMEALDLFIVPIGREPDGFRYQAVFNYAF